MQFLSVGWCGGDKGQLGVVPVTRLVG